jgi:spermidine synthase
VVHLLLLAMFVASGCSALIYEVVWFQLLELVIGSSAVSLGVLLGTFMGGLCLGSLAAARLVKASSHPLRTYALIELGIGALAVAVLIGLPYVGSLYVTHAGHGFAGILLRAAVCAVLLLPPTVLMGATLPVVARWVEATPQGVSWLGLLYTCNIAGAVFGSLFAGFYLLRVHDMAIATYVAAAINGALALTALALAACTSYRPADEARVPAAVPRAPAAWPVHVVIGLSGLTSLGAQVIWTRVLSLLLGASVYTFSIILAVFLIGLGIGSSFGAYAARAVARPRLALGVCQLLLVAAVTWAAVMINGSLPYWPVDPSLMTSPWFNFQLDLARVAWAILPATCLWGASFPLALAAAAKPGEDPGRMVGTVYAANTIGAIVGALAFSIVLVPLIGTQQAQRLILALTLVAGIIMLLAHMRAHGHGQEQRLSFSAAATAIAVPVAAAVLLAAAIPPLPGLLVAYGRQMPQWNPPPNLLYVDEGMNASVAVTEHAGGTRHFHVSGKTEASTEPHDMRLQRMLGHFSALLHGAPRSVLIVGFGSGVTAGSFVLYPEIERIVICEIEPLIPGAIAPYFRKENYDVLKDPRVEVIYDDARHYLLTTKEKFDVITSDPIHPWVKGAAALYTREYFELVKERLNPGGVVTQWVPLYETSLAVVKSEVATFFSVFPAGIIWGNEIEDGGYDMVLFGQSDAAPIDVETLQRRLDSAEYWRVRDSLAEVGFYSAIDLMGTFAGRADDLKDWLKDAEINTDRTLRLQYMAGMVHHLSRQTEIYRDLLAHRQFPEFLFVAEEPTKNAIEEAIAR